MINLLFKFCFFPFGRRRRPKYRNPVRIGLQRQPKVHQVYHHKRNGGALLSGKRILFNEWDIVRQRGTIRYGASLLEQIYRVDVTSLYVTDSDHLCGLPMLAIPRALSPIPDETTSGSFFFRSHRHLQSFGIQRLWWY
ncbi:hypothetical protein AVEN_182345-1 [Araneus ventricosus]|uniref:Uncharacterized protein n=1 Tax=Araneus ventricosus TaxID=182803 RepID=A0A4Y2TQB5_ARAVE|nr:hypothetical protein AVEN_182345-1 [Araneus ventricosus]